MNPEETEHYLSDIPEYDSRIGKILPNHQFFLDTCLSFIPDSPCRILELGCGTGLVTSKIAKNKPLATVFGMDKAPEMIAEAKAKNLPDTVRFVQGDITEGLPGERYDVIISTLCLHHIPADEKVVLYSRILDHLTPDTGVFICGDVFKGEKEWKEQLMMDRWRTFMLSSGMDKEAVSAMFTSRSMNHDSIDTVHEFLRALGKAGFTATMVPYLQDIYAVVVGWKSPPTPVSHSQVNK